MAARMGWLGAVLAAGWLAVSARGQELATGGDFTEDIVVDGVPYRVHVFTNTTTTHTFEVLVSNLEVEYLIVGGGGGGGSDDAGGGGGGGVLSSERPGSTPFFCAQQSYPVQVGAGGRGSGTSNADLQENGESSSIFGFTALGGGFGANGQAGARLAGSAGTGGGGDGERPTNGSGGTDGQGFKGGNGFRVGTSLSGYGGGGGGAGSEGLNGISAKPGDGGNGFISDIHGAARHYGAGGGGGDGASASGSRRGGGGGAFTGPGIGAGSAVENGDSGESGSGGGGGASATTGSSGGAGGAGIVIVRYVASTELPRIHNVDVADRTDTTAAIVGTLITNGVSEATVALYWATTDYTNNLAGWVDNGDSMAIGPYADGAVFTNTISGLSAHTTYYWNHSAVNPSGTVWAAVSSSPSFRTLGPPSVDNADGATAVSATVATLHGTLLDGAPADVYVDLWADGADVTNRFELGSQTVGAFSVQATGLTPDTTYGYRGFASNDYGTAWADAPSDFTTLATAFTEGNVTWSGAGSVSYWDLAANWVGNEAPAKTTTGELTFPTTDTSRLDGDYAVGNLRFSNTGHTIELDGRTLEVADIRFASVNTPRGNVSSPGTIRLGSTSAPSNIQLNDRVGSRFRINSGVTLGGHIGTITSGGASASDCWFDIRGVTIEGGVLDINTIAINERTYINMDNTTSIDTLHIHDALRIRGRRGRWIGDPDTANHPLPTNLVVLVGSDSSPAIMEIGERTANTGIDMGPVHFNASTGGSFTGRLTRLRVGHCVGGGSSTSGTTASMDLTGMDVCDIETPFLWVGTAGNDDWTPPVKAFAGLPVGTVTAGEVVVGRGWPRGTGSSENRADLLLDGTHVTATNAVTIRRSGIITVNLYGESAGMDLLSGATFDIQRTSDETGAILHLDFKAPPDPGEDIYWGLRIEGNVESDLIEWIGLGALTSSFDDANPAFDGKHVGVFYANGYTYFAMADEDNFDFNPVAIAQDRTLEVESGGTVTLGPSDIDNGSFDPQERDFTLTLNYGAEESGLTELELDELGPHIVTLVITIDDEPSDTAQADVTVTLINVIDGTDDDLVWTAGASTELMDRPEWFWGANWDLEQPPLNPSGVNLTFPLDGTSIAAPLTGTNLTVGDITIHDAHHTIEVSTNVLTVGNIGFQRAFSDPRLTVTGSGIVRIGQAANPADISIPLSNARLTVASGTTLGGTVRDIRMAGTVASDRWIDLRGAVMENGILEVDRMILEERAHIYIDDTTVIDTLKINNELAYRLRRAGSIGDPDDPDRRLPANLDIIIGSDADPAVVDLGIATASQGMGPVYFNASSGGAFIGRLARLRVAHSASSWRVDARMELAGMNSCDVETVSLSVASSGSPARGRVSFPQGTVTAGDLTIGRDAPRDADHWADLELNDTRVAITNAATVNQSGIVTVTIGGTSSGLELTAGATLSVDGEIHIDFTGDPVEKSEPHYGISWDGDQTVALQALWDAEAIVVTGEELLSRPVEVFEHRGVTYLGLAPLPPGSLFMLR